MKEQQLIHRILRDKKFTLVGKKKFKRRFSDGTLVEITNVAGDGLPESFDEPCRISIYIGGSLLASFADKTLREFALTDYYTKEAKNEFISESYQEGSRGRGSSDT